jgi:hypothetical protein
MTTIRFKLPFGFLLLLLLLVSAIPVLAQSSNDNPQPDATASSSPEAVTKKTESETVASADAKRTAGRAKFEFTPRPQDPDADKWHFTLTPYIWLAGITGDVAARNLGTHVDASIFDDDVDLNFGFMATFEARKNKWLILNDLQFTNLGVDRSSPGPLFGGAEADFKTFILNPEVGYRVASNSEGSSLDVTGGVRYWHLRTDLTFTPGILAGRSVTESRGWVDAVGGVRGRAMITPKLFVLGRGDIGGGGSKFTYQLFGGGGFLVTDKVALVGGYRHLSVNYDKDGFLFDTALAGILFGASFRF